MAMKINNEETCRLIRELADLTGESLTDALTEAVRERLARIRQGGSSPLSQRLLAIGRDCAAHLKGNHLTIDHGEMVYGEAGLPE